MCLNLIRLNRYRIQKGIFLVSSNKKKSDAIGSEFEIYDGYTFSDLTKQIHMTVKEKREMINSLVQTLQSLVVDMDSALTISPTIVDYIKIAVSNDDALIKMAKVLQDYIVKTTQQESTGNQFQLLMEQLQTIGKLSSKQVKALNQTQLLQNLDVEELTKN